MTDQNGPGTMPPQNFLARTAPGLGPSESASPRIKFLSQKTHVLGAANMGIYSMSHVHERICSGRENLIIDSKMPDDFLF
jgi:hypothetical protein